MSSGHETLFDIPQLEPVQGQHVLLLSFLLVLEPGYVLGGQHEPVIPRAAFHYAQVMDAHISLTNDLVAQSAAAPFGRCIFGLILSTKIKIQ